MTFLSSEVLEAVQLKDSLLAETLLLNTAKRRTDAGIHARFISLSLITALACTSIVSVAQKSHFGNLQQQVLG